MLQGSSLAHILWSSGNIKVTVLWHQPMRLVETCIWEMLGCSLGHNTFYVGWCFTWYSSVLRIKCRDVTSVRPWPLRSKLFTIEMSCQQKVSILTALSKQPTYAMKSGTKFRRTLLYPISGRNSKSIFVQGRELKFYPYSSKHTVRSLGKLKKSHLLTSLLGHVCRVKTPQSSAPSNDRKYVMNMVDWF